MQAPQADNNADRYRGHETQALKGIGAKQGLRHGVVCLPVVRSRSHAKTLGRDACLNGFCRAPPCFTGGTTAVGRRWSAPLRRCRWGR